MSGKSALMAAGAFLDLAAVQPCDTAEDGAGEMVSTMDWQVVTGVLDRAEAATEPDGPALLRQVW